MYIHRVVTKGVPGLPDQDLTFWDEWLQKPLDSVLITGPNGSGKTTLLKVIAGLWDAFGFWLRGESAEFAPMMSPESARLARLGTRATLTNAQAAAVEIRGLLPQPLWLWIRNNDQQPNWLKDKGITGNYAVGETIWGLGHRSAPPEVDASLKSARLLDVMKTNQELLMLGGGGRDQAIPNMIFFPTENRNIADTDGVNNQIQPEPLYQWLVGYKAETRWNTHIESMLRNLKVRDPAWFADTVRRINTFLVPNGRTITDFDDTLRLRVQDLKTGQRYTLSELSGGEQQIVIFIFMIGRWLMEGGIVLIDEPDMSVHPSWQRLLITELKNQVSAKSGQLILTSHSPHTWEAFHDGQRFDLAIMPNVEPAG